MKQDLETREDVESVVAAFYEGIEADPVIGRHFAGVDWGHHLPRMVDFWTAVTFQTGEYHGRPFDAHARLVGLEADHFERWLERFRNAVDDLFAGARADEMKARADSIAGVFRMKLGLWDPPVG